MMQYVNTIISFKSGLAWHFTTNRRSYPKQNHLNDTSSHAPFTQSRKQQISDQNIHTFPCIEFMQLHCSKASVINNCELFSSISIVLLGITSAICMRYPARSSKQQNLLSRYVTWLYDIFWATLDLQIIDKLLQPLPIEKLYTCILKLPKMQAVIFQVLLFRCGVLAF